MTTLALRRRTTSVNTVRPTVQNTVAIFRSLPIKEQREAWLLLGGESMEDAVRTFAGVSRQLAEYIEKILPYAMIGQQVKHKKNRFRHTGEAKNPLYPILRDRIERFPDDDPKAHYKAIRQDHPGHFFHDRGQLKGWPRWKNAACMMRCYNRWKKSEPATLNWFDEFWLPRDCIPMLLDQKKPIKDGGSY